MSLVKYASSKIVEIGALRELMERKELQISNNTMIRIASVVPIANFLDDYIYTKQRSISALEHFGPNGNFDGFREPELIKSYGTFINTPFFKDHQNWDPKKAYGINLDSVYIPDGHYVITLAAISKKMQPDSDEMVRNILANLWHEVSMGASIKFSLCSVCGHKAESPDLYCEHIKYAKGSRVDGKLVYEDNYGIDFFEQSCITTEAADKDARISEVWSGEDLKKMAFYTASNKTYIDFLRYPENLQKNIATISRFDEKNGYIYNKEDKTVVEQIGTESKIVSNENIEGIGGKTMEATAGEKLERTKEVVTEFEAKVPKSQVFTGDYDRKVEPNEAAADQAKQKSEPTKVDETVPKAMREREDYPRNGKKASKQGMLSKLFSLLSETMGENNKADSITAIGMLRDEVYETAGKLVEAKRLLSRLQSKLFNKIEASLLPSISKASEQKLSKIADIMKKLNSKQETLMALSEDLWGLEEMVGKGEKDVEPEQIDDLKEEVKDGVEEAIELLKEVQDIVEPVEEVKEEKVEDKEVEKEAKTEEDKAEKAQEKAEKKEEKAQEKADKKEEKAEVKEDKKVDSKEEKKGNLGRHIGTKDFERWKVISRIRRERMSKGIITSDLVGERIKDVPHKTTSRISLSERIKERIKERLAARKGKKAVNPLMRKRVSRMEPVSRLGNSLVGRRVVGRRITAQELAGKPSEDAQKREGGNPQWMIDRGDYNRKVDPSSALEGGNKEKDTGTRTDIKNQRETGFQSPDMQIKQRELKLTASKLYSSLRKNGVNHRDAVNRVKKMLSGVKLADGLDAGDIRKQLVDQVSDRIVNEIFVTRPEGQQAQESAEQVGQPPVTTPVATEQPDATQQMFGIPPSTVASSKKAEQVKVEQQVKEAQGDPKSEETPGPKGDVAQLPAEPADSGWDLFPDDKITDTAQDANKEQDQQLKEDLKSTYVQSSLKGGVRKAVVKESNIDEEKRILEVLGIAQEEVEAGLIGEGDLEQEAKRLFVKSPIELKAIKEVVAKAKEKLAFRHPDKDESIMKTAISISGSGNELDGHLFDD